MLKNEKNIAFSLIEIAMVLIIIGILVTGITQGSNLISRSKLTMAVKLTNSAEITSIKDLSFWLEASSQRSFVDDGTNNLIENGDKVANWLNFDLRSSNPTKFSAIQGDETKQPTYVRKAINKLPALLFEAVDDQEMAINYSNGDNHRRFTIFSVVQRIEDGDENDVSGIVTQMGEGGFSLEGAVAADRWDLNLVDTLDAEFAASASDFDENPVIISLWRNDGIARIYKNGDLKDSKTGDFKISGTNDKVINIGSSAAAGSYFNGYIAEVIYFSRNLKNSERKVVEEYLANKYDIGLI